MLLDRRTVMTLTMDYLDVLRTGSLDELCNVPVGVKGTITKDGVKVSDFVPLMVPINESGQGWPDRVNALVGAGHDLHKVFDYYGKPTTPWDVIQRCAVRSTEYMARRRRRSPRTTKGIRPVRYRASQPMKKQKA